MVALSAQSQTAAGGPPLAVVLACEPAVRRRAAYVLDTLLQAAGIPLAYVQEPPSDGPWLLYGPHAPTKRTSTALHMASCESAWCFFETGTRAERVTLWRDLAVVFDGRIAGRVNVDLVEVDLVANAFYFLSSWSERRGGGASAPRSLYVDSDCARLNIPQDIVDRYLACIVDRLRSLCQRIGAPFWPPLQWPGSKSFAVVMSHDVDYVPVRRHDNVVQAGKAVLRHLVRHRDPGDALRAARGWFAATLAGRDPYGCIAELIAREQALGLRSSFQVAVRRSHPQDVNYDIRHDQVRDYLRAITDAGFELCLHGSFRSTQETGWYEEEVALLTDRLGRPRGSRQHYLAFDYDSLFEAQEHAGIEFDMSMGFPDRTGPRAGFSFPYFPYNLREDRPYRVLQISLFLMDATLRGYMRLRPERARAVIESTLADLASRRGCASLVWHPIVFGGARDPGYDELYFDTARRIGIMGGCATDGRSINEFWRSRAQSYASFGEQRAG